MKRPARTKLGRPTAGRDVQGRPMPVTEYPRINIHVSHKTDKALKAIKHALGQSPRVTIERAIDIYIRRLPADRRQAVEAELGKQAT